MKSLIVVTLCLLSVGSFAKRKSYHGTYSIYAPTEEEVVEKLQDQLPDIKYMRIKDIITRGRWEKCSFRTNRLNHKRVFDVTGVTVTKMYKIDSDDIVVPYYRAAVRYYFGDCHESNND